MSYINQYKDGKISKEELLAQAKQDPALYKEVVALLGDEMSDEELDGIAAAGISFSSSTAPGANEGTDQGCGGETENLF